MNLWVLFLCRFLMASKVKRIKLVLAAVLAAAGEVFILCMPFGSSSIKIPLGFGGVTAVIICWTFHPKSLEYFLKLLSYFYLAIVVLGGILIFLEAILGRKNISMFVWGISVVFVVFIVERVYLKITAKSDFREVVLTISENKRCRMKALVDSGNGLMEPISRMPVSVVEEAAVEGYKEMFREEKFRLIPFHSVGKECGMLEAYFIEKMEIENEGEKVLIQEPIIAITKGKVSAGGKYQMILHPKMLEQGGRNSDF